MAAEKEENVLDLFSLFAFLKETPKAFWGKPEAPGPVSASLETGLLMSAESGFVLLLIRPSEHCFEKPSLFFCSVDLWASRI